MILRVVAVHGVIIVVRVDGDDGVFEAVAVMLLPGSNTLYPSASDLLGAAGCPVAPPPRGLDSGSGPAFENVSDLITRLYGHESRHNALVRHL